MTSILLASTPVHGHVKPVLSLAAHLVAAGHRVRFLTGARYRAAVDATGADFLPLPAGADYDDRAIDETFPERAALRGLDRAKFDAEAIFLRPIPAQVSAVDAALAAEPADVIIAETMFTAMAVLALRPRSTRPALMSLGVLPMPLPSVDTAPFGLGIRPMAGPLGRLRNRALYWAADRLVFSRLNEVAREVFGEYAEQLPASVFEAVNLVDSIVQLTVEGFEYPRSDRPDSVHFVGPLPGAQPRAIPQPSWWADVAAAKRVVHVTQGTVANRDFGELVRPTLAALADDPDVLVVVATGGRPVAEVGELPANARVAEFLDYDALLPFVDVLVTNGGYGGVHEALRRGIPLVTAGVTEDKPEVGARVVWSGVGVALRSGRPSAGAVRRAVRRVLGDDRYAARAAAVAEELSAAPGFAGVDAVLASLVGEPVPFSAA